jgi:hypothetical protein
MPLFRGGQKIPVDGHDKEDSGCGDDDFRGHLHSPPQILARLSRSELETTETELKAIAAEAIMGFRSSPARG